MAHLLSNSLVRSASYPINSRLSSSTCLILTHASTTSTAHAAATTKKETIHLRPRWENSSSSCANSISRHMGRRKMWWRGSSCEMSVSTMTASARSLIWAKKMSLPPLSNYSQPRNRRDWTNITSSLDELSASQPRDTTATLRCQKRRREKCAIHAIWSRWSSGPRVNPNSSLKRITQLISSRCAMCHCRRTQRSETR